MPQWVFGFELTLNRRINHDMEEWVFLFAGIRLVIVCLLPVFPLIRSLSRFEHLKVTIHLPPSIKSSPVCGFLPLLSFQASGHAFYISIHLIMNSFTRKKEANHETHWTRALYPMSTTLVGVTVNSKPNFMTVAHVGVLNHGIPQYLSIGLGKVHYSNDGIKDNKAFSICLPSEDLPVKTDYCGIVTGKKTDKAGLFDVFYGKLKTAPMIRECPVNMELRLYDVIDFPTHDIFIGELA